MALKKIWGIMSYWNEEFYIRQSIYAALPFVDKLLLVDGAYYQPDIDNFFSTDATNSHIRDIIWNGVHTVDIHWYTNGEKSLQFENEYPKISHQIHYRGWKNEMEKRQFMIDCIPDDDIILIIDADTLTVGDPAWFREQVEAMSYPATMIPTMDYIHPAGWWDTPMLLRKIKGMKYGGTHYNIEYPEYPFKNQWMPPINMHERIQGVFQLNMGAFYRQPSRLKPKMETRLERGTKEDFDKRRREILMEDFYKARKDINEGTTPKNK